MNTLAHELERFRMNFTCYMYKCALLESDFGGFYSVKSL